MITSTHFLSNVRDSWQKINNWLQEQELARAQEQARVREATAHLPYLVRREIERECWGKH